MQDKSVIKIKTNSNNLLLRVLEGHFASNHSHSNYYIDVAAQKSRLSEARAVAKELCRNYNYNTQIIDTILCLDGTEVIGTCLADELTENNFMNINVFFTFRPQKPCSSDYLCRYTGNDRCITAYFQR